jgi:hypothetical protein
MDDHSDASLRMLQPPDAPLTLLEDSMQKVARSICREVDVDYATALRFLFTRMSIDEVLRSEMVAMKWAEERYGTVFFTTGGICGDVLEYPFVAGDPQILVEVTVSSTQSLQAKAMYSATSFARLVKKPLKMVVGVRVDSKTNQVIEFLEIPLPPDFRAD